MLHRNIRISINNTNLGVEPISILINLTEQTRKIKQPPI